MRRYTYTFTAQHSNISTKLLLNLNLQKKSFVISSLSQYLSLTSVAGEPVPVGDTQHFQALTCTSTPWQRLPCTGGDPCATRRAFLVRPRGSCLESKRMVQLLGRAGEPGLGFQYNGPADYARVDPQLCSAYRPLWPGSCILTPRPPCSSDVCDDRGL